MVVIGMIIFAGKIAWIVITQLTGKKNLLHFSAYIEISWAILSFDTNFSNQSISNNYQA